MLFFDLLGFGATRLFRLSWELLIFDKEGLLMRSLFLLLLQDDAQDDELDKSKSKFSFAVLNMGFVKE
jgi:hypothetical protein